MNRRAFSLIELIIAVALGIALTALATQALVGIRRIVGRSQALVGLHDQAALINRTVGGSLQAVHPGGLWRLDADPGADGVWGETPTGCDDMIRLTWLACVSQRNERTFAFGNDWANDLTWARIAWQGANAAGNSSGEPRLLLGHSRAFRQIKTTPGPPFSSTADLYLRIYPQPRRDRRRDLNDNDLRYVSGLTPAIYASLINGKYGDGIDLDAELAPLHAPNTLVTDCAISWIDRRGHAVGWDSRSGAGIAAHDAGGTSEDVPGGDAVRAALSGTWLDGRLDTSSGDPDTVDAMRPVLLRLTFTLVDDPGNPQLRADAPAATFSFSFPLDPILGAP